MFDIQHLRGALHRLIARVTGRQARNRTPWHQHYHYELQRPEQRHLLSWESLKLNMNGMMKLCPGSRRDLKWMLARWISDSHKMPTGWLSCLSAWIKLGEIRKCQFPKEKLSVHFLIDGQKHALYCRKCCLRNFVRRLFSEHSVQTLCTHDNLQPGRGGGPLP